MEKRLIDRFTEDFESVLATTTNMEDTFQKAKEKFEKVCGFTPYSNYNSYRAAKYKSKNKFR